MNELDRMHKSLFWAIIINAVSFTILAIISIVKYQDAYKDGYVQALINQERGAIHDYVLKEGKNGELEWTTNHERTYHTKLTWRKKK